MSALAGNNERAERLRRNLQNVRPPVPSRTSVSTVYTYARQFHQYDARPKPRPKKRRVRAKRQPKPNPVMLSESEPVPESEPIPESEQIPEPEPIPESEPVPKSEPISEPETPVLVNEEDVDSMSSCSSEEESLSMDCVEGVAQLPTPPPEAEVFTSQHVQTTHQQVQATYQQVQATYQQAQATHQQVQSTYSQPERSHHFDFYSCYISPTETISQSYTELLFGRPQTPDFSQWETFSQRTTPDSLNHQSNINTEYPITVEEEETPTDWRMTQDIFTANYLNLNARTPDPCPTLYQDHLNTPIPPTYTPAIPIFTPFRFTYTPVYTSTFHIYTPPTQSLGISYNTPPPVAITDDEVGTDGKMADDPEPEAFDDKDVEEGTSSASVTPEGKISGMSHRVKRIAMMRPGVRRSSRRSAGAKDAIHTENSRRGRN